MGCIFSALSNIIYFCEKISSWLICASLLTCVVTTLIMTLVLGIGIGYNYCYVNSKTANKLALRARNKYVIPRDNEVEEATLPPLSDYDIQDNMNTTFENESNNTNIANETNTNTAIENETEYLNNPAVDNKTRDVLEASAKLFNIIKNITLEANDTLNNENEPFETEENILSNITNRRGFI